MSTRHDPLARYSSEGPDRLSYRVGIALDASDFVEEQTYHRGRLARALKYLFGVGTVAGLKVEFDDPELSVQPGIALDPLGRVIELNRPACINLERWLTESKDVASLRDAWQPSSEDVGETDGFVLADVFIRFVVCPREKAPAFASGPFDATNAVADSRLRDGYEISLVPRQGIQPGDEPPVPDLMEKLRSVALAGVGGNNPVRRSKRLDVQLGVLHEAILNGWRDDTMDWETMDREHAEPRRMTEVPAEIPATSVLLARVRVPATRAPPDGRPGPISQPPDIDNSLRRFVFALGALTQLADIT